MSVLVDVDFTGGTPRISVDTTLIDERIAHLEAENKRLRSVAEECLALAEGFRAAEERKAATHPAGIAPAAAACRPRSAITVFGLDPPTTEMWSWASCRLVYAERLGK